MSKKKQVSPTPATVINITLGTDGTGTLITKRGDLATLNSFSFKTMDDIIAAIKQGAAHLVEFEKNPPPKESPTATPPGTGSTVSTKEAVTETPEPETAEPTTQDGNEVDTANTTAAAAPVPAMITSTPANEQLVGVTTVTPDQQLSLF